MSDTLKLSEKCRAAEKKLSEDHGGFALFSMIQREATAGKWDVVASAPWLATDRAGIQLLIDGLRPFMSPPDWLRLASTLPVAPDTEFVQSMTRRFDVEHELLETGLIYTDDVTVDRAIIITANRRLAHVAGTETLTAMEVR